MADDLDIEQSAALLAYLRRTGRIGASETPCIENLAGGVSCRTVLVERPTGEAWVLKQALAKLRVTADWFSDPDRNHREALGIRWLSVLAPGGTIPALIFEDHESHLLAMQAVPQPHENWKTKLLAGELEAAHVKQFAELLATIHREADRRRHELGSIFAGNAIFESLRSEPYYGYPASQVAGAGNFLHALIDDTRARRLTLVHGDYSPKNVLIHHGRCILLDHEVIHWGDPAFDVGFSTTHLLSKAGHIRGRRRDFAKAANDCWQTYRHHLGTLDWTSNLESFAIRHTLGCLLGRVAGRSPLEYLNAGERARQRAIVVALMADVPATMAGLIEEFVGRLDRYGND